MTKRINAMTARKNLGELLEGVYYRGDEVVVERAGKPMGVIIPITQYAKIEKERSENLALLHELWSRRPAVEDVAAAEAEILAECEAVRHGAT